MSTTDLVGRVEELASRVRVLEDRLEIAKLMVSYGPAVDSGAAEATGSLWLDGGVYDAKVVALDGSAEIARTIAVDGDRAVATCYQQVVLHDAPSDGFQQWRVSANRWGMVRTSDGWRVARRWNRPLDGDKDAWEIPAAAQCGAEHGVWTPIAVGAAH